MEWRPARWSACLPLLIFPCTIKSRSFLAPAHPGGPGKRAVKRLWCGGGGGGSSSLCLKLFLSACVSQLTVLMDTTCVPTSLRAYLPLYLELITESPVLRDGGVYCSLFSGNNLYCFLHCISKNDTDVAHYNFNVYQPIFVISGTDVAERVCYRMMICYPTSHS